MEASTIYHQTKRGSTSKTEQRKWVHPRRTRE